MTHHLVGWLVAAGVLAVLIGLGAWSIERFKKSPNRAALAGMMLLFGSFLRVDPPPPPRAERVVRDEDAAGDRPGNLKPVRPFFVTVSDKTPTRTPQSLARAKG